MDQDRVSFPDGLVPGRMVAATVLEATEHGDGQECLAEIIGGRALPITHISRLTSICRVATVYRHSRVLSAGRGG